ncbi:MAG: hypothetical protein AB1714_07560 [Acidobacteriota bacterium]
MLKRLVGILELLMVLVHSPDRTARQIEPWLAPRQSSGLLLHLIADQQVHLLLPRESFEHTS